MNLYTDFIVDPCAQEFITPRFSDQAAAYLSRRRQVQTPEAVGKLFGRVEALNAVFALTGSQTEVFDQKMAAMLERMKGPAA